MQKAKKCQLCKNEKAIYKIHEQYGSDMKYTDEYIVCESCRKMEEKMCRNWGYGFNSEVLQES